MGSWTRLLGLALPLALCGAAAARPQDLGCQQDAVCKRHFVRAEALYRAQAYEQALAAFQAAYGRRQTPILMANIGRTLQRLGRLQEALGYFERSRAAAGASPELKVQVGRYLEELRAELPQDAPQVAAGEGAPAAAPTVTAAPVAAPVAPALALTARPARAPRPRWRLVSGGVALGLGVGLLDFGVAALVLDGRCADPALSGPRCSYELSDTRQSVARVYDTLPLGAGLTVAGAALTLAGVVLLALPGPRRAAAEARP